MHRLALSLTIGVLFAVSVDIPADDQTSEDADTQNDGHRKWILRRLAEMNEYEVHIDQDGAAVSVDLIEQPLLNWSNPLRRTARGALYLWTTAGKPRLVCCTFHDAERIVHEMQSLGNEKVTWTHPQHGNWQFDPPAAPQAIPDAPRPAVTRPLRLVQMRKLAARFSAQVNNPELMDVRQLPQPVYRYPEETGLDGAIFAFVQGTDPECLLLVQATEEGWSSRIVRMTSVRLIVSRDGRKLREYAPTWEVPDPSYRNFYIKAE